MTPDELFDAWERAWSGRDKAAFAPLCHEDVHYEDPLTPEPLEGAAAIAGHAERLWNAFPDARLQKTGDRLVTGPYVAAPCKLLATHRREVAGLAATNRFVIVHAVLYCELREERLLRVRPARGAAEGRHARGEGAADAAGLRAARVATGPRP